ncbi:MAG: beta-ketoacyl synthase N-terminal-like domain-containing protein [Acidobacteriota bacterium]
MAGSDIVITRVGMVTAVGLSAPETAASVRAATMRFGQVDWLDRRSQPFTVAAVPDAGLPELSFEAGRTEGLGARDARLLRIGGRALAECLRGVGRGAEKPPLVLALPGPERQGSDPGRFLKLLAGQAGGLFDLARSATLAAGRAGGLMALGRAAEMIRSGRTRFAVAGGLDSYVDQPTLAALDLEKRVKSDAHLDGFIPGEGAAFLLLATPAAAAAAGLPSLAVVSEASEGFEQGHLRSKETYLGEGLATTLKALVQAAPPPRPFVSVWSSMNGESHWAKEWGVAFLRSRDAFDESCAMNHPADCFGDAGAAAGTLLAGLACLDASRGPALVYASSDDGPRASLSILPPGAN